MFCLIMCFYNVMTMASLYLLFNFAGHLFQLSVQSLILVFLKTGVFNVISEIFKKVFTFFNFISDYKQSFIFLRDRKASKQT